MCGMDKKGNQKHEQQNLKENTFMQDGTLVGRLLSSSRFVCSLFPFEDAPLFKKRTHFIYALASTAACSIRMSWSVIYGVKGATFLYDSCLVWSGLNGEEVNKQERKRVNAAEKRRRWDERSGMVQRSKWVGNVIYSRLLDWADSFPSKGVQHFKE